MADPSPGTVTVTLRPTVDLTTLKTAIKQMEESRRETVRRKLKELLKSIPQ